MSNWGGPGKGWGGTSLLVSMLIVAVVSVAVLVLCA